MEELQTLLKDVHDVVQRVEAFLAPKAEEVLSQVESVAEEAVEAPATEAVETTAEPTV